MGGGAPHDAVSGACATCVGALALVGAAAVLPAEVAGCVDAPVSTVRCVDGVVLGVLECVAAICVPPGSCSVRVLPLIAVTLPVLVLVVRLLVLIAVGVSPFAVVVGMLCCFGAACSVGALLRQSVPLGTMCTSVSCTPAAVIADSAKCWARNDDVAALASIGCSTEDTSLSRSAEVA